MDSKLKYAFGAAMVLLVVLTIALAPSHPNLRVDRLDTHVMESNALYFKNLRQFYYEITEDERSGYQLYHHPDQKVFSPEAPRLKIVDNWRQDQAYVVFEMKDSATSKTSLIIEQVGSRDTFAMDGLNALESIEVCASLHTSFADEKSNYSILTPAGESAIWQTPDERRVLKTILKDYFKLVGAL